MRTFVESRWFALFNFISVIGSGICLYVWPQTWLWALLVPAVLLALRCVVKRSLYLDPLLVGSLLVFVLTAALGYWAAYDETAAWHKFCLIVAAVLFCMVIVGQPAENLKFLAGFWFVIGVGLAAYFLVTIDFNEYAVKFQPIHQVGLAWMRIRPITLPFTSIHPNDAGGLPIILSAYGVTLFAGSGGNRLLDYIRKTLVVAGFAIVLLAFFLSSSRGAYLAAFGAMSIWVGWRSLLFVRSAIGEKAAAVYPALVTTAVLLLGTIVLALPSNLLGPSFSLGGNVVVSRAEVMRSGLWIVQDFPFTGGGLGSFPGLYSQYVLSIPFYSLMHSHNMYLDVAVEQGILGSIVFATIYLVAILQLISAWRDNRSPQMQWLYLAASLSLFTAIFHGMVDDYIYGGRGTMLAFVPAAMAMWSARLGQESKPVTESAPGPLPRRQWSLSIPAYVGIVAVVLLIGLNWNRAVAQWYANLGAVRMSKLDLANYPADRWRDSDDVTDWAAAELDLRRALDLEMDNQTANHRLGLIRLMSRDFQSASAYLLRAYENDTRNRGILKNLGYSYLWLGESEKAEALLARLPEAKYELDVYVWWWNTHARQDLAQNAMNMAASLETQP